jgi:hypothetical protein
MRHQAQALALLKQLALAARHSAPAEVRPRRATALMPPPRVPACALTAAPLLLLLQAPAAAAHCRSYATLPSLPARGGGLFGGAWRSDANGSRACKRWHSQPAQKPPPEQAALKAAAEAGSGSSSASSITAAAAGASALALTALRAAAQGAAIAGRACLGAARTATSSSVGRAAAMQLEAFWQRHSRAVYLGAAALAVFLLWWAPRRRCLPASGQGAALLPSPSTPQAAAATTATASYPPLLRRRLTFRIASIFVGVSEGLAEWGMLAGAAAAVLLGALYVRRYYAVDPEAVYRLAMLKLNTNPGVLEVGLPGCAPAAPAAWLRRGGSAGWGGSAGTEDAGACCCR